MTNNEVIRGSELKLWRKSMGVEQKVVAIQMGISPATLCRIERDDRPVTGEQFDKLKKFYTNLPPTSRIMQSAAEAKELKDTDTAKQLPAIETLTTIGRSYQYKECTVVPSHYYARWCGQETRVVNQTIERLQEQSRLEIDEDFFKLTPEEARDFVNITNCDLDLTEVKKGVTLITRRTVNTLSHYFNDPNSIAKSRSVNEGIIGGITNLDDLARSDLPSRSKMLIMNEFCKRWLEADEVRAMMGEKIETIAKELTETDLKVDQTKKALEDHKQASRFTSDQMLHIEGMCREKSEQYGHYCVSSIIKRHLKDVFLGRFASAGTYKDISSRHFDEAVMRVRNWIPTQANLQSIQKHRIKDGKEPTPTMVQPAMF